MTYFLHYDILRDQVRVSSQSIQQNWHVTRGQVPCSSLARIPFTVTQARSQLAQVRHPPTPHVLGPRPPVWPSNTRHPRERLLSARQWRIGSRTSYSRDVRANRSSSLVSKPRPVSCTRHTPCLRLGFWTMITSLSLHRPRTMARSGSTTSNSWPKLIEWTWHNRFIDEQR